MEECLAVFTLVIGRASGPKLASVYLKASVPSWVRADACANCLVGVGEDSQEEQVLEGGFPPGKLTGHLSLPMVYCHYSHIMCFPAILHVRLPL